MRRRIPIFRALWPVTIAVAALLAARATAVSALFLATESENVPIDRVIANLERRVAANPSDVRTRVNLARVHAMAWATKSAETRAFKPGPGVTAGDPDFGHRPGFQGVEVRRSADPELQRIAADHLHHAIEHYGAALEVDPSNGVALLGKAWCLDQAGEKAQAIAGYRKVLELVWPRESVGRPGPSLGIDVPTTAEVAGYLIPLLDPRADAAEITTLRAHVAQVKAIGRPVTPVVVPLRDDARVADLVD